MRAEEESTHRAQKRKGLLQWFVLTCFLVAVDQASKAVVRATLSPGSRLPLLDEILYVAFVPNYRGFSWFVPALPEWVKLPFLSLRILIFAMAFPVYSFYVQSGQGTRWAWTALIGVSAGTLGNVLDDLFLPYTVDFIQVLHSPSANFADLFSYVGVGALLIEIALRWKRTEPRWQGFRYHWAQAAQVRRAFFSFLRYHFGRRQ